MANSCQPLGDRSSVEEIANAEFTGTDNRRYWVERTPDGKMVHHESLSDEQGVLYDQAVEIAYALGSGRHGRSYLAQRDGVLSQSPLTWYSQQQRWDFSPGFHPERHERFERRVGDGCLYCHVGRPNPLDGAPDLYGTPALHESTIGCERCHGPGEEHVAYHREAKSAAATDPIVNPSSLEPAKRDAVCYVCHLQGRMTLRRFGRGFFDFRPGDRLEDVLLIYTHGPGVDGQERTMPVSQVEQMLVSRCYQASEGRMGCTSCHNPHSVPTAESKIVFYREKCLSCHADDDCSAPDSSRFAAGVNDACTQCHMPALPTQQVAHTALTDHRIMRRPANSEPTEPPADPAQLQLFAGAARHVPERELQRSRGLLLMEAAEGLQSTDFARLAQQHLAPGRLDESELPSVLTRLDNDPIALEALALSLAMTGRTADAERCWEAAVRAEPRAERALFYLALSRESNNDLPGALRWLDKLQQCNPYVAEVHARRAHVLAKLGDTKQAINSARDGLALDPTRHPLRELLIQLYESAGEKELADLQQQLGRRIRDALRKR